MTQEAAVVEKPKRGGRRPKVMPPGSREVNCLGLDCDAKFISPDPSKFRLCKKCTAKRDTLSHALPAIPVCHGFRGLIPDE